jgi:hypothetical protein
MKLAMIGMDALQILPRDGAKPWFLAGGVAAANCLAAYTPKGAASLAASYDNNAAPGNGLADGTYDCTLGVAPTWDITNGWTGNSSSMFLFTGLTYALGIKTVILRYSNLPTPTGNRCFWGIGSFNFLAQSTPRIAYSFGSYGSCFESFVIPTNSSGVICVSGNSFYRNGSFVANLTGSLSPGTAIIALLAANLGVSRTFYYNGSIQAIAFHTSTFSDSTVAALTAGANAL